MEDKAKDILKKCCCEKQFMELSQAEKEILDSQVIGDSRNRLKDNNTFLGKSDKVKFFTFNLPKGLTCPEKTPTCASSCYQAVVENMLKGENQDSAVVYFRKLNWYLSLKDDFVDRMVAEILRKRPANDQEVVIRIHASGDFYSKEYIAKWMQIALITKLKGKSYKFVAYTKSFNRLNEVLNDKDFLEQLLVSSFEKAGKNKEIKNKKTLGLCDFNIHIIASVMDDTLEDTKGLIRSLALPIYHATSADVKGIVNCEVECASCMKCYDLKMNTIITRLR